MHCDIFVILINIQPATSSRENASVFLIFYQFLHLSFTMWCPCDNFLLLFSLEWVSGFTIYWSIYRCSFNTYHGNGLMWDEPLYSCYAQLHNLRAFCVASQNKRLQNINTCCQDTWKYTTIRSNDVSKPWGQCLTTMRTMSNHHEV